MKGGWAGEPTATRLTKFHTLWEASAVLLTCQQGLDALKVALEVPGA